jgi:hypothetical protein
VFTFLKVLKETLLSSPELPTKNLKHFLRTLLAKTEIQNSLI